MGASQTREARFLNREYNERLAAQQSYAFGNYYNGMLHDSSANEYGYKADRTHARRFQRGKTALPFAPHAAPALPLATTLYAPTVLEVPVGEIVTQEIIPTTVVGTTYVSPIVETIEMYEAPVVEEEWISFAGQPTVTTFEHVEPAGALGFVAPLAAPTISTYW